MTDDERDARLETLTDAIADTNRSVAATNRAVAALTNEVATLTANVTSLAANVTSLASDVGSLSRLMRTHLIVDHDYPDVDDDDAS